MSWPSRFCFVAFKPEKQPSKKYDKTFVYLGVIGYAKNDDITLRIDTFWSEH